MLRIKSQRVNMHTESIVDSANGKGIPVAAAYENAVATTKYFPIPRLKELVGEIIANLRSRRKTK